MKVARDSSELPRRRPTPPYGSVGRETSLAVTAALLEVQGAGHDVKEISLIDHADDVRGLWAEGGDTNL